MQFILTKAILREDCDIATGLYRIAEVEFNQDKLVILILCVLFTRIQLLDSINQT